jgi:hypothetical protein
MRQYGGMDTNFGREKRKAPKAVQIQLNKFYDDRDISEYQQKAMTNHRVSKLQKTDNYQNTVSECDLII